MDDVPNRRTSKSKCKEAQRNKSCLVNYSKCAYSEEASCRAQVMVPLGTSRGEPTVSQCQEELLKDSKRGVMSLRDLGARDRVRLTLGDLSPQKCQKLGQDGLEGNFGLVNPFFLWR